MADSTISAGTTIRGRIQADADLEVQGHVEGNVEGSGNVTITASAMLKSNVTGRELSVAGAVNGDLRASDLLVLEEGARVVGDVSAPTIGIRPGALVRGRIETAAEPSGKGPSRAASAARTQTKEPAKEEARKAPAPVMPKAGRAAQKKTAQKKSSTKTTSRKSSAKKSSSRRTTSRNKAAKKKATKKSTSKRAKKAAPKPAMPALKKRTKKASKRKSR